MYKRHRKEIYTIIATLNSGTELLDTAWQVNFITKNRPLTLLLEELETMIDITRVQIMYFERALV